jgi:hypothetical protein
MLSFGQCRRVVIRVACYALEGATREERVASDAANGYILNLANCLSFRAQSDYIPHRRNADQMGDGIAARAD